jgi:hypothetical protein
LSGSYAGAQHTQNHARPRTELHGSLLCKRNRVYTKSLE